MAEDRVAAARPMGMMGPQRAILDMTSWSEASSSGGAETAIFRTTATYTTIPVRVAEIDTQRNGPAGVGQVAGEPDPRRHPREGGEDDGEDQHERIRVGHPAEEAHRLRARPLHRRSEEEEDQRDAPGAPLPPRGPVPPGWRHG